MSKLRRGLTAAFFLAITGCAGTHAAEHGRITKLQEIALRPGVNKIEMLVPDGRAGMIVKGWRGDASGDGYNVYMVMLPNMNPLRDWDVVAVDAGRAQPEDTLADDPRHGANSVAAVRFARGWLDGAPQTLLFTARRDLSPGAGPDAPAKVTVTVYRLATGRNAIAPNLFERVTETPSRGAYCNADLALAREFGLTLPPDYAGPNREDGCLRLARQP